MGGTMDLLRLAAAAERLRWQMVARRFVARIVLAVGALVFLCAALTMAHMMILAALAPELGAIAALAILGGIDIVLALGLAWAATRLGPGADERNALAVRRTVQDALLRRGRTFRMLGLLVSVLRRLA